MTGPTFTEAFEDWHSPNAPTYEQAVDRAQSAVSAAITLEQELAAAEAESLGFQLSIARVLDLLDGVLTLQPADPDTGDRNVSLFALMEALDGEPS